MTSGLQSNTETQASVLLQRAMLFGPVMLFAILGWQMRWIVDDGFIYLRVVEHITNGYGPVFNAGERVEAFTGPLWLTILTLAELILPLRLEWSAVIIGLGFAIAGFALLMAGSAALVRQAAPQSRVFPFGILVPLGIAAAWIFATSGLESGLVIAWLGACLLVLAHWASRQQRLPLYAAAIIGMGWLIRPELAVHSALFVVLVLALQWHQENWQQRLQTIFAAICIPVAYQIFRMGYYGAIVANSAIAKDASRFYWDTGWAYLVDFAGTYWLWLAIAIVILGGYLPLLAGLLNQRAYRAIAIAAAFAGGGVIQGLYIVAAGGDWLHGRLLLPALYSLIAPVAVLPLGWRYAGAALLAPWFVASLLVLRPYHMVPWHTGETPITQTWSNKVLVEQQGWPRDAWQGLSWYEGEGFYYDRAFGMDLVRVELDTPSDRLRLPAAAIGGVGASGYALGPDWQIIDLWGLAHPLNARMISTPSMYNRPRNPGHQKPFPNVWLIALVTPEGVYPRATLLPWRDNPLIPYTVHEEFSAQVRAARDALACNPLSELHSAVTDPLDWQRFINNLRGAVARTRLIIPPDPHEARNLFCS